MGYRFGFPSVGQNVTIKTSKGAIHGLVMGLRNENGQELCEVQLESGKREIHPINDNIDCDISFGTFEDVIFHLSRKNNSRHCDACYLSALYAFDLLANMSNSPSFLVRKSIIKNGILNYLGEEYSQAAYILIPQAEAILNQVLLDEGFLEMREGSLIWTSKYSNSEYSGKRSLDLIDRIKGAISLKDQSSLNLFINRVDLFSLICVINKLVKFKLNKIQEHDVSPIMILLHALYHVTTAKPVTSNNVADKSVIQPKEIAGVFYHGIDFEGEESWYPRLNILNSASLYTPDYIAYVEPNLGRAHISIHDQEIEDIKFRAFCGLGAITPRAGKYIWGASIIRSGGHLFKGLIKPTQLAPEEEAEILERSDIELKFEETRRQVNPNAASRLSCIFVADNDENIKRMFGRNPNISILEVSIPSAIRFTKVDVRWYEEYCRNHDEKYIENYWNGSPFSDGTNTWEYLVDGVVKVKNQERLQHILGDDSEY